MSFVHTASVLANEIEFKLILLRSYYVTVYEVVHRHTSTLAIQTSSLNITARISATP